MSVVNVSFGQTIYGGELDAQTGILTSRYNADGTEKETPDVITLTGTQITALLGKNIIYSDVDYGVIEVEVQQNIYDCISDAVDEKL